jgi:hypothetical protein
VIVGTGPGGYAAGDLIFPDTPAAEISPQFQVELQVIVFSKDN